MAALARWCPGDRVLELLLVAAVGAALVSGAAWLASRRLPRNAALRHLVLFAALVWCLLCPVAAGFSAAAGLTLVTVPVFRAEPDTEPEVAPPADDPLPVPPRQSPDTLPVAAVTAPPAGTAGDRGTVVEAPSAVNHNSTLPGGPVEASAPGHAVVAGVLVVWAAGAALMLVRLARDCGRVVRLRWTSRVLDSGAYPTLLGAVAAGLGMRRVPLLLASRRAAVPLAVGLGRAAVVLPDRLLGALTDDGLRDVLAHEVAHLQRGDQWAVLLQELAGAAYWPVVPVHALNHALRRAREELCDAAALRGRDPVGYGETLLRVAELAVGARPAGGTAGMFAGPGELERRIAGLIDPRRHPMTATRRGTAWCVTCLFVAAGVLASGTRFAAPAGAAPPASPAEVTPPPERPPADFDPADPKYAGFFRGRVLGPDSKPLAGAGVFVASSDPADTRGPVRATTDPDGRFEFYAPDMTYAKYDGLAARREGLLFATKPGFAPDWCQTWGSRTGAGFREWSDPVKTNSFELRFVKDDVPVRGRFLDPAGKPLAGARVRLTAVRVPLDGNLDTHLDRESKAVQMRGFLTGTKTHERSLSRVHLIAGLATETRTDADGRFTLAGVGRDRLAGLDVAAPGALDTSLEVMARAAPDVPTVLDGNGKPTHVIHGSGFTLRLKPGLTVRGLVRDRDTKAPIPGMWVANYTNPLIDPSYAADTAVTDAAGRFTISGLDPRLLEWGEQLRDLTAIPRPGSQHLMAKGFVARDATVVIECARGIPFRLKLVDEQGKPAAGTVEYHPVGPNPQAEALAKPLEGSNWPVMNRAARQADGTYTGFVLPGPGAVRVQMPDRRGYRPALVDPKAFFAPGRTDWPERADTFFGTRDTLQTIRGEWSDQSDYQAIVLVNPPAGSGPLELSATVVRDRPRRVTLVDPAGQPVVGVDSSMRHPGQETREVLNAATFSLTRLHPGRVKQMEFTKPDRRLIGYLLARGDSDAPITVRLQPWGTVTGRVVGADGQPRAGEVVVFRAGGPDGDFRVSAGSDKQGKFRVDRVIPGLGYDTGVPDLWPGLTAADGKPVGALTLTPGEVRDLGDVRRPPAGVKPAK